MTKKSTTPSWELGLPDRPSGLPRASRRAWNAICGELLAARKLSKSDAELVLKLVQAQADQYKGSGPKKAAASAEVERIEKIFANRQPFAEEVKATEPAKKVVPSLEAYLVGVKNARASFASRLAPSETVCRLDDGQVFEWQDGHAATVARQYALDATQGGIIVGELVKHAAARFLRELETGSERGLYFDPLEAANVKAFFDNYVNDWSLQPWQTFVVVNLFAWKVASGLRRFRWFWLSCGRKNGKSSLLAAIGLLCFLADLCSHPEVYSAATKRDQAKIIFKDAKALVKKSPELRSACKLLAQSIELDDDDNATFTALSADAHTMDGLRPQCALIDEIHEHPSDAVVKRLQSGTLSRPQPLVISATTAGQDRDSYAYTQHEIYERILRGTIEDFRFSDERFVFIAMLDEKDDPSDETLWAKANPNLGVSVDVNGLRAQATEFANDPQSIFSFRRFHCNIWNSVVAGHSLPQDKIAACVGAEMPVSGPMELRETFLMHARSKNTLFFGGFDLGLSNDLAAFVLITEHFVTGLTETGAHKLKTAVVPWFWMPSSRVLEYEKTWRVPLSLWIREGFLKIAGEELVDTDIVSDEIKKICSTYRCPVIGYDKWKSETMFARLHAEKVAHCVAVPQLPSILTTPSRELKSQVLAGTFAHFGNPIFKWMLSNVDLEPSEKTGGIKPAKSGGDRRLKIDGVSATVNAWQQLLDPENKKYTVNMNPQIFFL